MNPGKSGQLPDCLADPVIVGCTGFRVPFAGKKAKRLELNAARFTTYNESRANHAKVIEPVELITLFQTAEPERSKIPLIFGYTLSIGCLIWVLHDFHIVQAMKDFSNVSWKWVLIGMTFDVISYGVQALRWKFLLTPFRRIPLTHAIRAVYAGLFANLVFPLRPGELLRCYLISDSEDITIGRVAGSVG